MVGVAGRSGIGAFASRAGDALLAIGYFILLALRPQRRAYYGSLFFSKTEGGSFERSLAAFRADAAGRRLIAARPDSVALLRDRARLRTLPVGSLGRAYLDFIVSGGLVEDYLAGAIAAGRRLERDPARTWFRIRIEAAHDLRHVLAGYGPDPLGEACLTAFRFGQTRHAGAFVVTALSLVILGLRRQPRLWPALREAIRRGRAARALDLLPWEERMDCPLSVIQRDWGITPPAVYVWAAFATRPARIDLCRTFGPLSAMHAALDREGIGMPCGVVARFVNRDAAAIEAALAVARRHFPVLQTRLAWDGDRPMLETTAGTNRGERTMPPFNFAASASGQIWRYRLIPDGRDVWFQASWAHCAADGLSMLRLVRAISETLNGAEISPAPRQARAPVSSHPFATWLPRFLVAQRRDHVALRAAAVASPEVSWLSLPAAARDRIGALAQAEGKGMAGWLAAAVAIAFAEQQGQSTGDILLNIPVARNDLEATNGFGFGVGSLRLSVRLARHRDMPALARAIGAQIRGLSHRGWDRNLERLLGRDPRRHARFARIEAARSPDPNITISWKGHHAEIGTQAGACDVACFAAGPTLHVSAHSDGDGLSLSVTSRQFTVDRHALLVRTAQLLGCPSACVIRDLDDLADRATAPAMIAPAQDPALPAALVSIG